MSRPRSRTDRTLGRARRMAAAFAQKARPVAECVAKLRRLRLWGLVYRAAVCRGATVEEVLGAARTGRIASARRVAILALKGARPALSTTDLGDLLGGRDHTTIVAIRERANELERLDAAALVREFRSIKLV